MSARKKTLQALVQDFFVQHLTIERNVSDNTIASYRDAMKLFLKYSAETAKCSPDVLACDVLEVESIRGFLGWLERERGSSPRTRNHRLAALKAFARYIANVAPEHLELCRRVREIRPAKTEHKEIRYLSEGEVVQLLNGVEVSTPVGRRDRALLLMLYNTGARVQEIVDLNVGDVSDDAIPFVRLRGKGRKHRSCPIWSRTSAAVRVMLADRHGVDDSSPLFVGARGQRLSRSAPGAEASEVPRPAVSTRRYEAAIVSLPPARARGARRHRARGPPIVNPARDALPLLPRGAWSRLERTRVGRDSIPPRHRPRKSSRPSVRCAPRAPLLLPVLEARTASTRRRDHSTVSRRRHASSGSQRTPVPPEGRHFPNHR